MCSGNHDELTNYQRRLVLDRGQRILMGGRQVGKTETIVQTAVKEFSENQNIVVIAPSMRMLNQLIDRVQDELPHALHERAKTESRDHPNTIIWYESASVGDYDDMFGGGRRIDGVLVDEANHVDQELLFRIERNFDDVLLTATPVIPQTIVEMWTEHSPYWSVEHVPSYDAPFIEDRSLDEFRDGMKDERELLEVDARYDL